jgi:hypothetical protein
MIIEEDGLLGIAPGGQVIERAGEFDAERSSHRGILTHKILK